MGISSLVFNMKFLTKHPSKSEKPCNKLLNPVTKSSTAKILLYQRVSISLA